MSIIPVIKMSGRNFPGVVLQGDSLKNLKDLVEEIAEQIRESNNEELSNLVEMLNEKLAEYLEIYELTLKEHKIDLPYTKL